MIQSLAVFPPPPPAITHEQQQLLDVFRPLFLPLTDMPVEVAIIFVMWLVAALVAVFWDDIEPWAEKNTSRPLSRKMGISAVLVILTLIMPTLLIIVTGFALLPAVIPCKERGVDS